MLLFAKFKYSSLKNIPFYACVQHIFFLIAVASHLCAADASQQDFQAEDAQKNEIAYSDATILGLVEGLTEYLPVSSTGHLIICNALLGLDSDSPLQGSDRQPIASKEMDIYSLADAAYAYSIVIQIGAISAIFILYWKDLLQMALACCGKSARGRNLIANLMIAFLPAAILGLLLDKHIESYLGNNLNAICGALILGALVMFWVERKQRLSHDNTPKRSCLTIESLTLKKAFYIGCLQCLAMWPGTSRSMATITGGYLVGLQPAAAAKFSFLLGFITLSAASGYKIVTDGPLLLSGLELGPLICGILIAFITSLIAVKWFIAYISQHGMTLFAWYRIILACVILLYFN